MHKCSGVGKMTAMTIVSWSESGAVLIQDAKFMQKGQERQGSMWEEIFLGIKYEMKRQRE